MPPDKASSLAAIKTPLEVEGFPEPLEATDPDFSKVRGAVEAAAEGRLLDWTADFLERHGHDPHAHRLFLPGRRLRGPELSDLSLLQRLVGPEDDRLVHQEERDFRTQVETLAEKIDRGIMPGPLLVGRGVRSRFLCDGNHTAEALRSRGFEQYWTVSWRAWRRW
ncbi:MAG: hypothetical protein WD926_02090 [Patescibacteria group bacterium]